MGVPVPDKLPTDELYVLPCVWQQATFPNRKCSLLSHARQNRKLKSLLKKIKRRTTLRWLELLTLRFRDALHSTELCSHSWEVHSHLLIWKVDYNTAIYPVLMFSNTVDGTHYDLTQYLLEKVPSQLFWWFKHRRNPKSLPAISHA